MNYTTTVANHTRNQQVIDSLKVVSKLPLFGPDREPTGYYGLFTEDGDIVRTSSVTKDYKPHTREDVADIATVVNDVFPASMIRSTFSNGHILRMRPDRSERLTNYGGLWPDLSIKGTFEGSFEVGLWIFRDDCSNLMMMRTVDSVLYRIPHRGPIRERLDEVRESLSTLREGWNGTLECVRKMDQVRLHAYDGLRRIFGLPIDSEGAALTGRSETNYYQRMDSILRRINTERSRTPGGVAGGFIEPDNPAITGWELYNAVQGYYQHRNRSSDLFIQAERAFRRPETIQAERVALAA